MKWMKKWRVHLAILALAIVLFAANAVYQQQSSAREATDIVKDAIYGTSNSNNSAMKTVVADMLNCVAEYARKSFSKSIEYDGSTYLEPSSFSTRSEVRSFRDLLAQVLLEMGTAFEVRAATSENCRHVVDNAAGVTSDEKKQILEYWEKSFNEPTRTGLVEARLSALTESYRQQYLLYQFLYNRYEHFQMDQSSGEFTFDSQVDIDKYNVLVGDITSAQLAYETANKAVIDYNVNAIGEFGIDVAADDLEALQQSLYSR